jgi:DNA-binding transcriptional LysR family regulator
MDILRLTLRQLQIFEAVARSGNTRAAGEELALSQSATSGAVNELERLLSLRLFDRVGKRLVLNENGRALQPRAQALLDSAHGLEDLGRTSGAQLESLRIGASTTIAAHVVPRLLADFYEGRQHEAVAWRSGVAVANTSDICARVAAFELDIGLIEGPCHDPLLEVHPWVRDEMVVVAANETRRLGARELRDAVWLVREAGSGTREATDQALLPILRSYRRTIELASSEAIRQAAALGLGLACISRWVAADMLASGALREVTTTLPAIIRQCWWVVHRDKQPTAALQRFIECVSALPSSR